MLGKPARNMLGLQGLGRRREVPATNKQPIQGEAVKLFFFYKNLFYKNVEAEINQNFKNVLRTFLRLRVD